MEATTISAKFAAYTWYTEVSTRKDASQAEAKRFAEENWGHFLGHADKGLGRLLLRLAQTRPQKKRRRQKKAA